MLYEIYCEEFHQKKIKFNENLNVILGTNDGHNSIGKSTFLLIVDFVFGGNSYFKFNEIFNHIGEHDIYFTYKFDNSLYRFCRNNKKTKEVWRCDENYNKISEQSLDEFCRWLNEMYKMDLPKLSFRDAIGRYIRVYGKENCDEKHPLHYVTREKASDATISLLKLFNEYLPIDEAKSQVEIMSKEWNIFNAAQKFNFISNIKKNEYDQNLKRIKQIETELQEFSKSIENQMVEIDLSVSEEALHYKNLLSNTRRVLGNLRTKYNVISNNQEYQFPLTSNTYEELGKYFPNVKLNNIEKVEKFHNKISEIFKHELIEEKNKLQQEIYAYEKRVIEYEDNLRKLLDNKDIPNKILQDHAMLIKERDKLQKQNEVYEKSSMLKNSKKESIKILENLKNKQFSIVQNRLNSKMKVYNDYIYNGAYNSPFIKFTDTGYSFYTPDDTGTGIAYKGLIIFDLAVLSLTKLPVIVHDSLILKQIYDNAIEKILELYTKVGKQVIIAFDKQSSYPSEAQNILNKNTILKLASNGKELFGRSWG